MVRSLNRNATNELPGNASRINGMGSCAGFFSDGSLKLNGLESCGALHKFIC